MAITLASDAFSDAEITDGIGLGDLSSATRLWVRHWEGALAAAQQYVEPAEVPGLAAEALIGTIAAIAIGRGPREDVAGFVSAAVRELGEDDEPVIAGDPVPVLYVSPALTGAFSQLDEDVQRDLRDSARNGTGDVAPAALTVLQHYYLAEHTDRAPSQACRRTHIALMSAADGSAREGLAGATWLHLSTCAWCVEAFHEVAFSNIALGSLIDPAVLDRVPATTVVPATATPIDPFEDTAPWAAVVEPERVAEPVAESFAESFAEPVAEAAAASADDDTAEQAAVRRAGALALLRGGRGRLVAATAATAAAVAVLVVVIGGQSGNDRTPAAASTEPTESAAVDSPTVDPSFGAPQTPSSSPTTTVAGPVTTAVASASATAAATAAATNSPAPTKTPTQKPPAPKPTQSAAPTPTQEPTPTPTPSPTATPTRNCNGLQELLGFCRR